MNKNTYIYSLEYPEGNVRYIGKANNPNRRYKNHLSSSLSRKEITLKSNWIYGLLNNREIPILNIIDEVDIKEWKFWESYYIYLYRSWGFDLKNGTFGGDGVANQNHIERKKISEGVKKAYNEGRLQVWNKGLNGIKIGWEKGKKRKKEDGEKTAKGLKEYYKTHDTWNKGKKTGYIPWNKGKKGVMPEPWNKGTKGVMVAWNKGISMRDESKEKCRINAHNKKPVLQFDLEGNFIKEYSYIADTGINNVISCCKGNARSAGGFLWLYKEDYNKNNKLLDNRVLEYNNKNLNMSRGTGGMSHSAKKVVKLNSKTNKVIEEYDSIIDAKNKTGCSGIGAVCNGKINTSGGFKWMFLKDWEDGKNS